MPEADQSVYEAPTAAPAANGKDHTDPQLCPDCARRFTGPAWKQRLGQHRRKDHGVAGQHSHGGDKPPKEKAPRPARARVSLSELGTSLWRGLSWGAARTDKMAASRMFQLQAGAAGPAFERAVKGTLVDRVLQPVARMGENGRDAATLLGAPIAAEGFLANPNAFTQAAFIGALEASLPQILRSMKDAKRRQEKMEADLAGMAEVFGKEPGDKVTINEVALWVLTGSTVPQGPPQEEPVYEGEVVG